MMRPGGYHAHWRRMARRMTLAKFDQIMRQRFIPPMVEFLNSEPLLLRLMRDDRG